MLFFKRIRVEAGKQNWFGVGVDLVILIVGVFLGIQVNNWNQARLERATGAEYRQRIIGDLASNKRDLDNRLEYFAIIKQFAARTLAALDRPVEDGPQAFLTAAYQASQISPRKVRRFTYDEALATGNFIEVGDFATRERLSNYYTGVDTIEVTLQNVTPYREHIRATMPPTAQEAVRTQCPEGLVEGAGGAVLTILPASCVIRMDQAEAIRHARAVRAMPGLRADLVRLMADMDVKLTLARFLNDRVDEVRTELAAAPQE